MKQQQRYQFLEKKNPTFFFILAFMVVTNLINAQDGFVDPSFNISGINQMPYQKTITSSIILNNNEVVIGGKFMIGSNYFGITKVDNNGDFISSFPHRSFEYSNVQGLVASMAIQPDGKIIIVGVFDSYDGYTNFPNGTPIRGIIRILSDGNLDQSFIPDLAYLPNTIFNDPNNLTKVIVGNDNCIYTPVNTDNDNGYKILKFDSYGNLDYNYVNNQPFAYSVGIYDLKMQKTGTNTNKIIFVGDFTDFNSTYSVLHDIARLNTDGTLDNTFNTGGTAGLPYNIEDNLFIRNLDLFDDDSILISGGFGSFSSVPTRGYAKLTQNGFIDSSFFLNAIPSSTTCPYGQVNFVLVHSAKILANQQILINHKSFDTCYSGSQNFSKLYKLDTNGNINTCFNIGSMDNVYQSFGLGLIDEYPSGKILIANTAGSNFNQYTVGGSSHLVTSNILRLFKNSEIITKNDTFNFACNTFSQTSSTTIFNSNSSNPDLLNGLPINQLSNVQLHLIGSIPSGITLNNDGTVTINAGIPIGQYSFQYYLSTFGNCPVDSNISKVTINITPCTSPCNLTLSSATGTTNQRICIGNSITPIIYTLSNNATNAVVTGLPTGLVSVFNNGVLNINGIPTALGIFNYTVTTIGPDCSTNNSLSGTITILPKAIFNISGSYCIGTTAVNLPSHDNNNVTGTWTNNGVNVTQINTNTVGTFDYIFTATTPNSICEPYVLHVTITTTTTTPSFSFPTSICFGSTSTTLPTISNNGVIGQWSPSTINTTQSETYTFTPNPNQCAAPISIHINIIEECSITLTWGSEVSCQLANDPRDEGIKNYDADIADGPCIRVCENSTITYTLAGGGIGTISYTEWFVTGGTVSQDPLLTNNTTCTITWGTASYCALQGIIHLNNGTTLQINKCIEKLAPPAAMFGILPNMEFVSYTECANTPIYFENLTTNNGGNDVLYYNWDFGDGTTSNEFEPNHTYDHVGDYNVTLQVFNGCSCSSSYEIRVHIVKNRVNIQCPSVVCEGERTHYSISDEIAQGCSNLFWTVTGGHLVHNNDNNSEVDVVWDTVDQDGFGYISVTTPTCYKCSTPIKIPVIKQHGTIVGNTTLCPKSQGTYALPQWPSTIFNWTIDDGGTGATLINNNNRNEIIVQSQSNGTIQLYCTYFNTLLGCGGNAQFTIHVKQLASLENQKPVCQNNQIEYQVIDENGNPIGAIEWTIEGPNGYSNSGSDGHFYISFPSVGTYNFTITDANYCSQLTQITVKAAPAAPTTITGPLVVCPGVPVSYSCLASPNAVPHWEVVGGDIIGSTTGTTITVNFNAVPTSNTTYTVKVWYEGELCNSNVLTKIIQRDVPSFNITAPNATVCGSTTMTYSTSYTTGENYIWSVIPETAGSVQSGQNSPSCTILWNQATLTANPNAAVKLEIRKCGATYPATYNVHVINHPDITINAPTTLCSNESFTPTFTMSVGTNYTGVTWDYGDGTIETLSPLDSVFHNYTTNNSATASYTVVATVHGGNGCLADATNHLQVTVATAPIIDVNPPDQSNICNNHDSNNSIFEASVNVQSGFSASNTIQWYRSDGTGVHTIPAPEGTAFIINVSHVTQGFGAGTYWATVTNVYNCSSTTQPFDVTDNCGTVIIGPGGPGGSACNCTYDYNVTYPCQSVEANISNTSCNLIQTEWEHYPHYPSDVVTSNTLNNYAVSNLKPGKYLLRASMQYDYAGTPCYKLKQTNFIIPYQAGIRYNVTCNSTTNNYTVTVLDHSVFYPQVGIQKYEYTTNGATWIDQGTATSYQTVLPPGTYILGVKISTLGYTPCIATVTLVLPNMPNANFTHDPYACQDAAMQFNALDSTPGLQYEWHFPNNAVNLQQNPVRTFNGSGSFGVTLTVTNQYGCYATSPVTSVQVKQVRLRGTIKGVPETTCEGTSITLNYLPNTNPGQTMPTNFTWYHNEVMTPAYANTTTPSITINQSGQYFAYVQDSNGCFEYKNPAVSVAFIPLPATPVIKGNAIACSGSPIHLSIPKDPNMHYIWSINNSVNPAWDNLTEIEDTQTVIGTYNYSVVAQVANTGTPGTYCSSSPGTFSVNVVEEPEIPILKIEVSNCNPYRVKVSVENPQNGVNYYWSNGYTGLETVISHDGPIQVRAEVFNCSVTAQVDLPRDLNALEWTFPKGCYAVCSDQPLGYLVGPLGVFEKWHWDENDTTIDFDHNTSVRELHNLQTGNTYQLYLYNGYCDVTLGTASISQTECKECAIEINTTKIECININGTNLYAVTFEFNNPYGTTVQATLATPGGEGYFDSSILQIPQGYSTQTVLFNTLNGFDGGDVTVNIKAHWKEEECNRTIKIHFPKECKVVESCNFGYKIKDITCINTHFGSIYDLTVDINNQYPIAATTTLSAPNGEVIIIPSVVTTLPGSNTYHFSLYPQNGFAGGAINLVFNTTLGSFHCIKERKFDLPENCHEPRSCEIALEFYNPKCQILGLNQTSYEITLTAYNPYGADATMNLMAPNGEGYFVANNLLLPPASSSQTFYFYPSSGFTGGEVVVTILIHSKEGICYSERTLKFDTCCFICPMEKTSESAIIIEGNLLRVAPNPAKAITTIFYNFVNEKAVKTIELTDVVGRTLKSWSPAENNGKIELDCTLYANGQYLILMKEDHKIVNNAKLITN